MEQHLQVRPGIDLVPAALSSGIVCYHWGWTRIDLKHLRDATPSVRHDLLRVAEVEFKSECSISILDKSSVLRSFLIMAYRIKVGAVSARNAVQAEENCLAC